MPPPSMPARTCAMTWRVCVLARVAMLRGRSGDRLGFLAGDAEDLTGGEDAFPGRRVQGDTGAPARLARAPLGIAGNEHGRGGVHRWRCLDVGDEAVDLSPQPVGPGEA